MGTPPFIRAEVEAAARAAACTEGYLAFKGCLSDNFPAAVWQEYLILDPDPAITRFNIHLPEALSGIGFSIINDYARYADWKANEHHWTTGYCWNTFIPRLLRDLGIPPAHLTFNIVKNRVKTVCGGEEVLDYHEPVCDPSTYSAVNLTTLEAVSGLHSVLRGKTEWTEYHNLYRFAHHISRIDRAGRRSGFRTLLLTDSMSIPIIPVLAAYCDSVLVIDNRFGNRSWRGEMQAFAPTHIVILGILRSMYYCTLTKNIH